MGEMIYVAKNSIKVAEIRDCVVTVLKFRQRAWAEVCRKLKRTESVYGTAAVQSIRRLCVLASSSRGGTSVTAELLQWQGADCVDPSGRLLTLPGEEKPHLILAGLAFPSRAERFDDLSEADAQSSPVSELLKEMGSEIGYPMARCDDLQLYATQLYRRLLLQWPTDLAGLKMRDAIARLTEALQVTFPQGYCDSMGNRRQVLAACVRCFPFIRPSFYDCWTHRAKEDALRLAGQFWSIEETPFVLPPPWHNATQADLEHGCLLLRDPSNAWRFPFWRAVFSKQKMDILHLIRDPRESVQGLCDGWNYPFGFQTMVSDSPLEISGYTDRHDFGGDEWKTHHLNFSINKRLSQKLIENHERANLVDVCAFQWLEAHKSILQEAERLSLRRYVVDFAALRTEPEKVFKQICTALNLECSQSGLAYARSFSNRWVMATLGAKQADYERWRYSAYSNGIHEFALSKYFDDICIKLGLGSISAAEKVSTKSEGVEVERYATVESDNAVRESEEDGRDQPTYYA